MCQNEQNAFAPYLDVAELNWARARHPEWDNAALHIMCTCLLGVQPSEWVKHFGMSAERMYAAAYEFLKNETVHKAVCQLYPDIEEYKKPLTVRMLTLEDFNQANKDIIMGQYCIAITTKDQLRTKVMNTLQELAGTAEREIDMAAGPTDVQAITLAFLEGIRASVPKQIRANFVYANPNNAEEVRRGYFTFSRKYLDRWEAVQVARQNGKRIKDTKTMLKVERAKLSAGLRYDILQRDKFRCQLCGRGADSGVVLEVDHIVPIARGGKTVKGNLRTLCRDCNRGKSAKLEG